MGKFKNPFKRGNNTEGGSIRLDKIGNKYRVYSQYYTAKDLYDTVMRNSIISDFNWVASATELMRVCNVEGFPKEYADGIKIAVLNCYSRFATVPSEGYWLPTDHDAVFNAYNSLEGNSEKNISTKKNFLNSMIWSVIVEYYEIPMHCGPTYRKVCNEWANVQFENYSKSDKVDFRLMKKQLKVDFQKLMKEAEFAGIFKEEDDEFWKVVSHFHIY